MKQEKTGDIVWLKIEESLKVEGCPICYIMKVSTEHYIENLLYEYVLDVGVRSKLHKSAGFCTNHAYKLVDVIKKLNDDGLKIAILYETILGEEIVKLEAIRNEIGRVKIRKKFLLNLRVKSKGKVSNFVNKLLPTGECPACFQERMTESLYVDEFYRRVSDDEFKSLFSSENVILCRYHLIEILKKCVSGDDEASLFFFLQSQILKIQKLLGDLINFIDKHDYQRGAPFARDEIKSWKFVLEYFSGKDGVIRSWDEQRPFNTKL